MADPQQVGARPRAVRRVQLRVRREGTARVALLRLASGTGPIDGRLAPPAQDKGAVGRAGAPPPAAGGGLEATGCGESIAYPDDLDEATQLHIRRVLAKCGGNVTRAAELLGIAHNTLTSRLNGKPKAKKAKGKKPSKRD